MTAIKDTHGNVLRKQELTTPWYKKAIVPWLILGTLALFTTGVITGHLLTRTYESRVMYEAQELSASARVKVNTPIAK